jgi:CDP-diacylglycerol---glycerol-3-phosphate 3-phosphatidyltransferase
LTGIFAHWPNRITALRFVGAIFLFAIFAAMGNRTPADSLALMGVEISMQTMIQVCFWLFVLLAATDALDGYIARHHGQVSAFGRIADPFVDKILILGVMIFMAVMPWSRRYIPAWLVVVVLSRELLVTGVRGYVESLGREFPADWFGKIKMIVQCITVSGVMWIPAFDWPDILRTIFTVTLWIMVGITVISTVGSGLWYLQRTHRILAEEDAR